MILNDKALNDRIEFLAQRVAQLEKRPDSVGSLQGRVEDLELWRGKIHNLLISISPTTKQERPSPTARRLSALYK